MHFSVLPACIALMAMANTAAYAAGAATATTQIYQQRTADGRIVLTDRPSPVATTERAWQMTPEDPVAARQRAQDVKAEAAAVSERVQRGIDRQRLDEEQSRRDRGARAETGLPGAADLSPAPPIETGLPYTPYLLGPGAFGGPYLDRPRRSVDRPRDRGRDGRPRNTASFRGSAGPESR